MTHPQPPTEQDAVKQAQILRAGLENMKTPAFRDYLRLFSLDLWLKVAALKDAGFTEAQALKIVIERKP